MSLKKIYKVRYLDSLGKEAAEFGFYESREDAMIRWNEVVNLIKMPGSMDIREITVIPDTKKQHESKTRKNFYEFKKESK